MKNSHKISVDIRCYRLTVYINCVGGACVCIYRRAGGDGVARSPAVVRLQPIRRAGAVPRRVSTVLRTAARRRQRPPSAVNVTLGSPTGRHLSRPLPSSAQCRVQSRVRVRAADGDALRYVAPRQLRLVLDLATPEGCKAELTVTASRYL